MENRCQSNKKPRKIKGFLAKMHVGRDEFAGEKEVF